MPLPTPPTQPSWPRRRLVAALPASLVLASTWKSASGQALGRPSGPESGARLVASPAQTEGPFYPRDWDGDVDEDLVRVEGQAAMAMGQVLHLQGRVLDRTGRPLPGAEVEIWQCDAQGVYRHPRDERGDRKRDTAFQGRGRTVTDTAGHYRFRTIRPVPYGGRTPHIHFRIDPTEGRSLTTQMYVFGEPRNASDGVLNSIRDEHRRESLIVRLEPAERLEKNALTGTFDVVLA